MTSRRGTVAAALLLAAAATGCRSLAPQRDDSTAEAIGKGLFWVPVCLALVVFDGEIEDRTCVSPVDILCDDGDWDAERDRWTEEYLTERDLNPMGH